MFLSSKSSKGCNTRNCKHKKCIYSKVEVVVEVSHINWSFLVLSPCNLLYLAIILLKWKATLIPGQRQH